MKKIQIHTMLRKKMAAITLVGASAAILIAAPYAFVSAEDTTTAVMPCDVAVQHMGPMHQGMRFDMDNRIHQYVTNGKITSEQADKLEKAMQEQFQKQQKNREDFIKNLPGKTGISESTLNEIMRPGAGMHRNFRHRGNPDQRLQQLVQNGKVTQDEATALETYFKNHHPRRGFGNSKAMHSTQQQHHQFYTEMCHDIATDSGISQSRVEEIMQLMWSQNAPSQGE